MKGIIKKIIIEGVVQGVGFRPFVYHLAKRLGISGFVRNTKSGVEVIAIGMAGDLERFIDNIRQNPPPLALIKKIIVADVVTSSDEYGLNTKEFIIENSQQGEERSIFLSPDVAICGDCKRDFYDKNSRYYHYPFVNCTNCGPRFSIITDYPYDRDNTTMQRFIMCDNCKDEYSNINSRRYHAEPISCNNCGPSYRLLDNSLKVVENDDIFELVRYLIKIGKIIAVKGIGGYHLVCDAKNKDAVQRLRQRKLRDTKPFAVMLKDIETVKKYCFCSPDEEKILTGKESPIVLLRHRRGILDDEKRLLISGISPYLGAMLPYAPYQFMLMENFEMLVFTSGNISGEPIVYRDEELKRLASIADYFLAHNREIVRFVEDSVLKFIPTNTESVSVLMRKSRGFAPSPLFLNKSSKIHILGLGGDLKSTISFIKEDVLIQSQYLGDLADYLSFEDYKKTIEDFKNFFALTPDIVVCDLHPAYLSSKYAEELSKNGAKLFKVQHHKAHIASVALEKGWFDEDFIGVALDGTGYGDDGAIWGGEVFSGNLKDGFDRVAHLNYVSLPFGDAAIKEPEKTAFAYLAFLDMFDDNLLSIFSDQTRAHVEKLQNFVKTGKIFTSSVGRLFDVVSFLLGFRRRIGYEGEAAIELENKIYQRFALEEVIGGYEHKLKIDDNKLLIDTRFLLEQVIQDFKRGVDTSTISIKFHHSIISAFLDIVNNVRDTKGINKVALSGGGFQNSYLLHHFIKKLEIHGFNWAVNRYTPPNDACISVGQCAVAASYSTTMW